MNINDIKLEDLLASGFKLEFKGTRKNDFDELEIDPNTFTCSKDRIIVEVERFGTTRVYIDFSEGNHYSYIEPKGLYSLEDLINLHRLIHG
jgi:hypothetical protein